MAIGILPPELLEEILQYVDGVSLVQAQAVCKLWNQVIRNLNRNRDVWKMKCLEEISKGVLIEITGIQDYVKLCERKSSKTKLPEDKKYVKGTGPNLFIGNTGTRKVPVDSHFWKEVYAEWYRGRFIGTWALFEVGTAERRNTHITFTCVKISGQFIFTGSDDGEVKQWKLLDGHFIRSLCGHVRPVTDIVLRKSASYYRRHTAALPYHHDLLISVSQSRNIYIIYDLDGRNTSAEVYQTFHTGSLTCISMFENTFVIGSDDRKLSVWKLCPPVDIMPEVVYQGMLAGHETRVKSVSIWKDTIISGSDDRTVRIWNAKTSKCLFVIQHSNWLSDVIIRDNIAFSLTGDTKTHMYEIDIENDHYKKLGSVDLGISTNNVLALRGNILAVGNNAGQVFLYHVDFKHHEDQYGPKLTHRKKTHATGDDEFCDSFHRAVAMPTVSLNRFQDPQEKDFHGHKKVVSILNSNEQKCQGSDGGKSQCGSLELGKPLYVVNTKADIITSIDIDDDGDGPIVTVTTNKHIVQIYQWCSPE